MAHKEFDIIVTNGIAAIYTPYSSEFVQRVKALGGRWDAADRCWNVCEQTVEMVREAMREIYGRCDTEPTATVTVVATFSNELSAWHEGVRLFGRVLAAARSRDSGARVGDGVAFIKGKPTSGGSQANWRTFIPAGCEVEIYDVPADYAAECMATLPEGITAHIKEAQPTIDRDALVEERVRLLARIAEIDALLGSEICLQ